MPLPSPSDPDGRNDDSLSHPDMAVPTGPTGTDGHGEGAVPRAPRPGHGTQWLPLAVIITWSWMLAEK
ncbi:hypothetical protein GCM10022244_31620 [Streptomyces gulbargensis]|uniref:Uncharacterized protein n=1 Tax=Streptomyces gulbargensis TaxID=364901 RepID=A0ABP7MG29_9ACTN